MTYAAGVGGAHASTVYPCGHMAYYDSGGGPPIICPICGARHQNAAMMTVPYASNNTNPVSISFAQNTAAMIQGQIQYAEVVGSAMTERQIKYPELAWLDREVSRYTKP